MRNLLLSITVAFFFSCDDGDLQIETIDFDSITTISTCNTVEVSNASLLFKINTVEALILELPANALKNEVITDAVVNAITESGPYKLTYRTFSDNVAKDYFCSSVPLTSPTVVEEIIAKSGNVLITTSEEDSTTYNHTITLENITFETSENNRITNLSINEFGKVVTTKAN